MFVQGGEVRANSAEGISAVPGSKSAGDFLLDLGHTHRLLGKVVGERNIVVGSESPDIVGISAQAEQEIGWLALSRSTAFSGFLYERIERLALSEDIGIAGTKIGNTCC